MINYYNYKFIKVVQNNLQDINTQCIEIYMYVKSCPKVKTLFKHECCYIEINY